MKKLLPIIIVVVLVVAGVGGFLVMGKGGKSSSPLSSATGTFSSIKDALSRSMTLECEYSDETGRKVKSYIKNGAVRADVVSSNVEESGSTIMKDKKMYFWNAQGGFTMTLPDDQGTAEGQEESKNSQGKELLEDLERYKNQCKTSVVSDSLFTPPSDVKFQDMSGLFPTSAPSVQTGGGQAPQVDQKDIQKYMDQLKEEAPSEE